MGRYLGTADRQQSNCTALEIMSSMTAIYTDKRIRN